jgi:DNA-binding CsgD family transcriptional regulator
LDVRSPEPSDHLELVKAIIDESRDAVRLFDSRGELLHQNAVAREMLSPDVADAVRDICRSAIDLGVKREAQLNGFMMSAIPLPSRIMAEPIGMLTVRARSHSLSAQALRERFGFSARESEVALLLAERRTDAEIAKALGISWHTVRSHIERIFELLGCHTRREAADRLSSSSHKSSRI